ncbi:MAG: site-specific integrase [Planctomycetales bacterium]|nr:site-specific integrase [Planctomycetales bacterium]
MFVFAAHTGARRSEMLRSRIEDVDLVTIREKKRVHGKATPRSVHLSPLLQQVLAGWLARHPGGQISFCNALRVQYSRNRDRSDRSVDGGFDMWRHTGWTGGILALGGRGVGDCSGS